MADHPLFWEDGLPRVIVGTTGGLVYWHDGLPVAGLLIDDSGGVTGAFIASTAQAFPPTIPGGSQSITTAFISSGATANPPSLITPGGVGVPFIPSTAVIFPPSFALTGLQTVGMPTIASAAQAYPPVVEITWVPEPGTIYDPNTDMRGHTVGLVWFEAFLPE